MHSDSVLTIQSTQSVIMVELSVICILLRHIRENIFAYNLKGYKGLDPKWASDSVLTLVH